jgi:hypothetical protein
MDENYKDVLSSPEPTTDIPKEPSDADSELNPEAHSLRDRILHYLGMSRPVRAAQMLGAMMDTDTTPNTDMSTNTASAIIEAARDAVKTSAYTRYKLSAAMANPMLPSENSYADKDPQTPQSLLPQAKITPQVAQKGQAGPQQSPWKLAYVDPSMAPTEQGLSDRQKVIAGASAGLGAGMLHRDLASRQAKAKLNDLATAYLDLLDNNKLDRGSLALMNQELAEHGLATKLINAPTRGIAKARLDKVYSEMASNALKGKVKGALPLAALGMLAPYAADEVKEWMI